MNKQNNFSTIKSVDIVITYHKLQEKYAYDQGFKDGASRVAKDFRDAMKKRVEEYKEMEKYLNDNLVSMSKCVEDFLISKDTELKSVIFEADGKGIVVNVITKPIDDGVDFFDIYDGLSNIVEVNESLIVYLHDDGDFLKTNKILFDYNEYKSVNRTNEFIQR